MSSWDPTENGLNKQRKTVKQLKQSVLTPAIELCGGWGKCNEPWETCELPPTGVML